MLFFSLVVQALVQGISEFLPISSSGHLILTREVFGWPNAGASFDVAVHIGTLAAVMLFFRRDVGRMVTGLGDLLRCRRGGDALLVARLLLATLPLILAGFVLIETGAVEFLRRPAVIAWATICFAIPLYLFDRFAAARHDLAAAGTGAFLVVGLAQVLALIPGTSRAGITITAARALGFERDAAAHLSMLLAMPAIAAAGGWALVDLGLSGNLQLTIEAALAAVLSCLVALAAIWLLMAWVRRASYTPFVIYRLLLGGALLVWLYA